jgi:hypothetical protein
MRPKMHQHNLKVARGVHSSEEEQIGNSGSRCAKGPFDSRLDSLRSPAPNSGRSVIALRAFAERAASFFSFFVSNIIAGDIDTLRYIYCFITIRP